MREGYLLQAIQKWGTWGEIAPGVSNGQSEIKFTKLEFARPHAIASQYDPTERYTGLIQAVLFEVTDRNLIGYPTSSGYRYCCTKELVSMTKCHQDRLIYEVCFIQSAGLPNDEGFHDPACSFQLGIQGGDDTGVQQLMECTTANKHEEERNAVQEKSNGWPKVIDIDFENNNTLAYSWEEAITIEETGMYYLWFVICDEDLASATVQGQTTWKNPTGDTMIYGSLNKCLCIWILLKSF